MLNWVKSNFLLNTFTPRTVSDAWKNKLKTLKARPLVTMTTHRRDELLMKQWAELFGLILLCSVPEPSPDTDTDTDTEDDDEGNYVNVNDSSAWTTSAGFLLHLWLLTVFNQSVQLRKESDSCQRCWRFCSGSGLITLSGLFFFIRVLKATSLSSTQLRTDTHHLSPVIISSCLF